MRDYITTIFNLIVGLLDADKLVWLAISGLGVVVVWQLLGLIVSYYHRFTNKCRKISGFLQKNGLTASNYNNFLALVAKMPQEFIRGYKTFEHSSYGLPSDYIRRFDSIDVELNGGVQNHGKSLQKAFIYGWTLILAILCLALQGSETALTGFAVADALLLPVLFIILAKILYFMFNAIKQQQYRTAVEEFNEMLDIMDEKIINNDNLPGPDVLAEYMKEVPLVDNIEPQQQNNVQPQVVAQYEQYNNNVAPVYSNNLEVEDETEEYVEQGAEEVEEQEYYIKDGKIVSSQVLQNEEKLVEENIENYKEEIKEELFVKNKEENLDINRSKEEIQVKVMPKSTLTEQELVEEIEEDTIIEDNLQQPEVEEIQSEVVTEEELIEQIPAQEEQFFVDVDPGNNQEPVEQVAEIIEKEETMEVKRGRGRPKKVQEGELVITNDKQFEEVLQRAEKLMRKSEEALSASQAKRVEKALQELVDAMTKYKEEN